MNKKVKGLLVSTAVLGIVGGATLSPLPSSFLGIQEVQAANAQKGSVNVSMPLTQAAKDQYRGKDNAKVSTTSDGSGKVFAYYQSSLDELTINIEFKAPDGSTASTTLFFTASETQQARGIDAEGNYYTVNVVFTQVVAPTPEPEPEPEAPEVEVPDLPTDPGNGDGEWEEEIPNEETPEVEVPETPEIPNEETPEVEVPETPEIPNEETPEVEVPETPEIPNEETPEVEVPETPETPEVVVPETPVEDGEDTVIVTPQKRVAVNGVYTVVAGDTLLAIANDFGISTSNLALWNNLTSDSIAVNDKLFIVAQALVETPVVTPETSVEETNSENKNNESIATKATDKKESAKVTATDKKDNKPTKLLQTDVSTLGALGTAGVGFSTIIAGIYSFISRKNKK